MSAEGAASPAARIPPKWSLRHRIGRRLKMAPGQIRARRFGRRGRQVTFGRPVLATGLGQVEVGDYVAIRPGARLECVRQSMSSDRGRIRIGPRTRIEDRVHIGSAFLVEIGEGALIASGVTIIDHDHSLPPLGDSRKISDMPLLGAPIVIGSRVWIGEKATVLKGVTIGDRSVVGAHAVVTKDVPPDSVAIGVPARIVARPIT